LLFALVVGCGHAEPHGRQQVASAEPDDGVRVKGSSVHAHILALIGRGQFAEAQALIAEASAAGLLTRELSTRLTARISLLTMKLGEVPARLQRVANFPSQLKDLTLFEIKQLLERKDFAQATHAQLLLAEKLIEQQNRLLDKL
jgi:hypothetical protein